MFGLMDSESQSAVIKVLGIGGGGCNAVMHMTLQQLENVDFICLNTDAQALERTSNTKVLQIGANITKGLGAGANPDIGRKAAIMDRERIKEELAGVDIVFITAGMGGGTGTGGAPVVAQIAKEMGILTVAVVTVPFPFEGNKRMSVAESGINELKKHVDSLIVIPTSKILTMMGKKITLLDAFKTADRIALEVVQGITELLTRPGLINIDFADIRTVMSGMGMAMISTGIASGKDRACEAAEKAVTSPLLEDVDISRARGILINVTAGLDMAIGEFEEVGNTIKKFASDNSTVVVGTVIDTDMHDELKVTIVLLGMDKVDVDNSVLDLEGGTSNHIDIQDFLRRIDEEPTAVQKVRLVVPESTPDDELAELIVHLSNVYKSVGGDELVIDSVANLPPNSASYKHPLLQRKGASR